MKIDEFDTTAPFSPFANADLTRLLLFGFDLVPSIDYVEIYQIPRTLALMDRTRELTLK